MRIEEIWRFNGMMSSQLDVPVGIGITTDGKFVVEFSQQYCPRIVDNLKQAIQIFKEEYEKQNPNTNTTQTFPNGRW